MSRIHRFRYGRGDIRFSDTVYVSSLLTLTVTHPQDWFPEGIEMFQEVRLDALDESPGCVLQRI